MIVASAGDAQPRILVCGDYLSGLPLADQCADALERLGCAVRRVNTEDRRRWLPEAAKRWSKSAAKLVGRKAQLSAYYARREQRERNRPVLEAIAAFRPRAALVIRGNGLLAEVLEAMRRDRIATIGWWIKDVRRVEQMLSERPRYDLYFCIHRNLCRGSIAYLPAFAGDPRRLRPAPRPRAYRYDIGFVGIWSEKRQRHLEQLADLRVGIVGPGWYRRNLARDRRLASGVVASRLHGAELQRFYQSARIVVNINQWDAHEASGTTLRVADVPACGAFLMTEYSPGIDEQFVPGRDLAVFHSPQELREQALYYLAHDAEREAVADAGHQTAAKLPTHEDRMRTVLRALAGSPAEAAEALQHRSVA